MRCKNYENYIYNFIIGHLNGLVCTHTVVVLCGSIISVKYLKMYNLFYRVELTCGGGCGILTAELLTFLFKSAPTIRRPAPVEFDDNKSTHLFASFGP